MRWLLAAALLVAWPARADSAGDLYVQGKYEAAIAAELAKNSAMGFANAARAALAEEASRDEPCLACIERAEDYARKAIAADPKLPDGQIYLAVSLGLKEHIEGPIVARLHHYPDQAKRAIDAALACDPDNVWALAALGGWNIEIVDHAGSTLADWLYGASLDKGEAAFAAAFKAAPQNFVVRYQYALTLSDYDTARFRGEIESALAFAADGVPSTVYNALVKKRAGELLALLKAGKDADYAVLVRKYEGYP
jgi:hypothetical protein